MAIIDYYIVSDTTILKELGARLRKLRLRKNITQEDLAERSLLSVGTIKSLEAGNGKLSTLVAILRELSALDQLNQFIPPVNISPLKMADASAKSPNNRERASGAGRKPQNT
ncbi:MAG: helix-turn-helix transcriptional regulator [Proteobacteria bacterium]|nr:helix-turn-helix transcriptional regulator [Pseudomonadota bacterium]